MSARARLELVWATARRYRHARRFEKSHILDEFCKSTGFSRKYAIGILNRPPAERRVAVRRVRPSAYGRDIDVLTRIWEVSGRLCAKRLAPGIPALLAALERHGELTVAPQAKERLLSVSASTVDRLLRPVRAKLGFRGQTTTKPGTLLRQQIPVRTFADWNEQQPGFMEIDLVAHCGDTTRGEHLYSLTMTDVSTEWTEFVALPNRGQRYVCSAIDAVRRRMPFPLLGVDPDNGSEFINYLLVRYCEEHNITFTRCRPYTKNDQCHVESKNGSIVRAHAGYWRYETAQACKSLAGLYSWLRLLVNFFQPSVKLVEKHRNGAKVTRRYDVAVTPCERLLRAGVLASDERTQLEEMRLSQLGRNPQADRTRTAGALSLGGARQRPNL